MYTPALVVDLLALLSVMAAIGAGLVLHQTWKTRVLRLYTAFAATVAVFAISRGLPEAAIAFDWPGAESDTYLLISILLQAIAGVVHVMVLPYFTYALVNRHPSVVVQRMFLLVTVVMGVIAVVFVVRPGAVWVRYSLSALLFSSIGWCVVRLLVWLVRGDRGAGELDATRGLWAFVWLSAIFVPLFIGDFVISQPGVRPGRILAALDGLSLPAYLLFLSIGSIVFVRRHLAMPPLYHDQQITDHCKQRFGLTEREAEVVEYVMEGYSVPDLAQVLSISAKTAENHLYSAYQKLSVSNRIQLFQTLMAHQ